MRVPLSSPRSSIAPLPRPALRVGPVYEREHEQHVRAGVLVIGEGSVTPRLHWDLLKRFAARAEWLRGTSSLVTRPHCYGVVRADGSSPIVGFCGLWQTDPRFTLLLAGRELVKSAVEAEIVAALATSNEWSGEDPFPRWQPDAPWYPVFWQENLPNKAALS